MKRRKVMWKRQPLIDNLRKMIKMGIHRALVKMGIECMLKSFLFLNNVRRNGG